MTAAAWIRARAVLRRHWRATVFLAVFAGLAGGAVMSAWSWSRRAHTVVPRRLDAFAAPDATFQSCPPGADPSVDLAPCFDFGSNRIAFDALVRSPHVSAAKLYVGFAVSLTSDAVAEPQFQLASAVAAEHGEIGNVHITRGATVEGLAEDEVVLSETAADAAGVAIGDGMSLSICALEFDGGPVDCAGRRAVRVAGLARPDSDILPQREFPPGAAVTSEQFGIFTTLGWWEAGAGDRRAFLTTSFVLSPGSTLADVRGDLPELLPDYTTLVTPYDDTTTQTALREATQLQGRTLWVVALILLLAALVFVGQALLRQLPRELAQHPTLAALGTERAGFLVAALLRATPIAVGAAALAVLGTAVASGLGPTGLASRAEIDDGLRLDPLVLTVGGLAVAVLVLVIVLVGTWRAIRAVDRRHRPRHGVPGGLPPVVQATLLLGRGRGARRSLAGTLGAIVAAVAAVVWAGSLVASLDRIVATPTMYGASWDYGIGEFTSEEATTEAIADIRTNDVVTAAATLVSVGPVELDSLEPFYVVSIDPIKGDLSAVLLEGRAPAADDEIAVGPRTLADLGLEIGDTLDSLPVLFTEDDGGVSGSRTVGPFRIVGTALISANDAIAGPGEGILATPATRLSIDPGTTGEIVVAVDPAVPEELALSNLIDRYGVVLTVPTPQADIRNLEVISSIPTIIAALVSALAFGAVANALIVNVRRNRRTLAVLRTLGFTGGQVVRTVATQANLLALAGLVLGVPLGLVAGARTWANRAAEIGVDESSVVSIAAVGLAALGALVGVNAAALWPGFRAGRADLGAVLRSE